MVDWPSLWAREPALRPDGVDEVCGTHAAALSRDAAVRWLAENSLHVRIYPVRAFTYATVGVLHDDEDDGPMAYGSPGDTLDQALFAACKAVLDARDASVASATLDS